MRVLIGHERFGRVREAFRARGHAAFSCDLAPAHDRSKYHLQCDIFEALREHWDLAIFHPPCTYLTSAAEWAYSEGPYHMKIGPDVLLGAARWRAREQAVEHVRQLWAAPIAHIAIENPKGAKLIGNKVRWANQAPCEDLQRHR